ncbi:hypothetical protein GF359_02335 [candidate division WOR-3 bacterium]|uniref:Tetratricopeptide repeat protein n=1 Tax=candidate division WOR-3 bacterium TaxID=2052148 RepID=A0A9D5QCG8_UNCW3|nr:hypothetical protein [candidate division WOR-3 bacterium]MBD3364032.1 hypothetical protein [candidate division WOR-3 bacterium]
MFNMLLLLLSQAGADVCNCGLSAREFAADTQISRPHWYISYESKTPAPFDKAAMRLLEFADSFYFASSDTMLSTQCQREVRRVAYALYEAVIVTFPDSYAEPYAKTVLAWSLLEDGFFREAANEFKSIFDNALNPVDARIIAAYGKALSHYYLVDYDSALVWFFEPDDYVKELNVTVFRDSVTQVISYNETADSIICYGLLNKAQIAEELIWWYDALTIWYHVKDNYPLRPAAGQAWVRLVDFYLQAKEVDKAISATDDLKSLKGKHPLIYQEAYSYALALMLLYMHEVARESGDEEYRKLILSLQEVSEYVERIYYDRAMEYTDTAEIDSVHRYIELIREFNYTSKHLPRPMTLLGLILVEAERYEEADSVFQELKDFPDAASTLNLLPIVVLQQACIQYRQGKYAGAVAGLEAWLDTHKSSLDVDPNLTAEVYWFFAMSSMKRADAETIP